VVQVKGLMSVRNSAGSSEAGSAQQTFRRNANAAKIIILLLKWPAGVAAMMAGVVFLRGMDTSGRSETKATRAPRGTRFPDSAYRPLFRRTGGLSHWAVGVKI
jgi:hypothetical protein